MWKHLQLVCCWNQILDFILGLLTYLGIYFRTSNAGAAASIFVIHLSRKSPQAVTKCFVGSYLLFLKMTS